jgi:RNA polymerase sigma-70 factor (sigma-E family)
MRDQLTMPDDSFADDGGVYVVRAAEPFETFFRREYPQMVAVAYGVSGSRWAAEELAQEACLRAYRSWDKIASYDKPGAWLRRVTINLASSHVRRRVSEVKAVERFALHRVEPIEPHPDDEMEFWAAVKRLPRRQREAVVLRYVDGMEGAEIAEVMGVAESSVRTHLQRGRETLAKVLDDGGET